MRPSAYAPLVARTMTPAERPRPPVRYFSEWSVPLLSPHTANSRKAQLDSMSATSTLYAIVSSLAEDVAAAEWTLYNRPAADTPDDEREPVDDHPMIRLWNRPVPTWWESGPLLELCAMWLELVGEAFLIPIVGAGGVPVQLWPASPARMSEVKSDARFVSGWVYTDPDGRETPFTVDEVIFLRRPSPVDPVRGMSPVQALMYEVDAQRYSAQWTRNYFLNSAKPAGVVEVPRHLSDREFREFRQRWWESHRGPENAHKVSILEHGSKWVETQSTMRDMQYVELRRLTSEAIMEAYRYPKAMLGKVEDVNRANAEANEVMYWRWLIRPRLRRWRTILNYTLMAYWEDPDRTPYEWDFELDAPEDMEAQHRGRNVDSLAVERYVGVGFEPMSVLDALDLPEMEFIDPVERAKEMAEATGANNPDDDAGSSGDEDIPSLSPDSDPPGGSPPAPPPPGGYVPERIRSWRDIANVEDPLDPELAALDELWQAAVEAALAEYQGERSSWIDDLVSQIADAVAGDDPDVRALGDIAVESTGDAEDMLADAMLSLGNAAAAVTAEWVDRRRANAAEPEAVRRPEFWDVTVPKVFTRDRWLGRAVATVTAMAKDLATSATREALRLVGRGQTEVTSQVKNHLEGLSDRYPRDLIGGALTGAQNDARVATYTDLPDDGAPRWYEATEVLDKNTCDPCAAVDGTKYDTLEDVEADYPSGGYINCAGRERCRGTFVPIW